MPTVLSLHALHFTWPSCTRPLLDGADLTLGEGERVGLSGANGCGKSTLLHIITGLLTPCAGDILFDGIPLVTGKDFRRARPRMGYLLQHTEDQLFCPTVLEDVAFGPLNLGLSSEAARERAQQTLEDLGIAHLARRAGCNLSGGEQKLAALAAVLSMRPRLLLLDEPTNDLDPQSLERLTTVILEQNLPFLAVSHDAAFLQRTCPRIVRLADGRLR